MGSPNVALLQSNLPETGARRQLLLAPYHASCRPEVVH